MKMIDRTHAAMVSFTLAAIGLLSYLQASAHTDDPDRDRGDVPGWVMITLMTAIVVIGLLAIFQQQVFDAVRSAFSSVKG